MVLGFQLPASIVVVFVLDRGYEHLWQVIAITYASLAVVYALTYRRGRFLDHSIA